MVGALSCMASGASPKAANSWTTPRLKWWCWTVSPDRGRQRATGKSCCAGTAEVARSGVVGAARCCWVGGPGSANDTMFGDTGCPEEGPLGLWVPCHPGIENLSSIESAARPKYELRFRHPDLRSLLRTKGTQQCPVISVFITCMQSLPFRMLPEVTFSVLPGLYRLSLGMLSAVF